MSIRALHTAVYDALASFPQAAQFSSLAHAQVRNLLADHLTGVLHHDGWVQRDEEKTTPAGAAVTPDFYQVGHTYTDPSADYDWKFRVDAITTHPENGERTALGWRHFRGEWAEMAYGEDSFEIHLLAGMTDGGDR